MSPTCASPLCKALTMSVPVSTTLKLASTPCCLKKPFSAPMNIGRWPKLLAITTSSLGSAIFSSRTGCASCAHSNAASARLQSHPQYLRVHAVRGHAPTEHRLNIVDDDIRHLLAYFNSCTAEMRLEHD